MMNQLNGLYLLAVLFSFLMGLAIQQGSTCTVSAINEYLNKGTINRIKSLLETAAWVCIGEMVLKRIGWADIQLPIWQISIYTVAGAILLGLGAYINGACAVGTISRIGSGEWDFIFTIIGFFLGALLVADLPVYWLHPTAQGHTGVLQLPDWVIVIVVCLIAYRSWSFYKQGIHPYFLTVAIGILFLLLLVIDKAWSYTDLLIDVANAKHATYFPRLMLFIALLLGASVGGLMTKNKPAKNKISTRVISRRFLGGAAMGLATIMLPGSHDSLILLYLPLLLGNAWLGFVLMVTTILFARKIERAINHQ